MSHQRLESEDYQGEGEQQRAHSHHSNHPSKDPQAHSHHAQFLDSESPDAESPDARQRHRGGGESVPVAEHAPRPHHQSESRDAHFSHHGTPHPGSHEQSGESHNSHPHKFLSPGRPEGREQSRSPHGHGPRSHHESQQQGGDDQPGNRSHKQWLKDLALAAMKEGRFRPLFEKDEMAEVATIEASGVVDAPDAKYVNLDNLPWVSIDNDDTMDIDQVSAAVEHPDGSITIYVGVADVDGIIPREGDIDQHASSNTTSVYTPAVVFTMLPEKLCYDLTSLKQDTRRKAFVVSITYADAAASRILDEKIQLATVINQAKLAYNSVSAWLDGGAMPAPLHGREDLQRAIIVQDKLMDVLLAKRRANGTLEFDRPEMLVVFDEETIQAIIPAKHSRSSRLIENIMIAANNVMSRLLSSRGYSSIQRVLPKSERWDQIVALAKSHGFHLSNEPDSKSLRSFLGTMQQKMSAETEQYQDLCLTVIKLIGRGEYVAMLPDAEPLGHFALAVSEYAHSTAPNRRYPDIIVHRIVRAALSGKPSPYDQGTLAALADHCTEREGAASKLERKLRKSAACILMRDKLGAKFTAVITGVTDSGTWARFSVNDIPAEGRVIHESRKYRIGEKIQAELVSVDVSQGFIDIVDQAQPPPQSRSQSHARHQEMDATAEE